MTAPSAHAHEWRAFVGPPFKASSHDAFWDWTVLTEGSGYDPETAIPPTTLGVGLNLTLAAFEAGTGVAQWSDTTGWPTDGGFWVGPGQTGETWGYCTYKELGTPAANQAYVVDYDTIDGEYSGIHQAGATMRFWWPISTDDGRLTIREYSEGNLVANNWTARTTGYALPLPALRIGHLFLLQARSMTFANQTWGNWTVRLVGWISDVRAEDDANKERRWQIEVVSLAGMLNQLEVDGIRVGNEELQEGASAVASSTLAQAYKAYGDGEFEGADPQLSPSNAVDQRNTPPWISERSVGQTNTPANPGTAYDGVATGADALVSQVHAADYPGQAKGYRWFEFTILDSGTYAIILVYSKHGETGGENYAIDYLIELNQEWTAGERYVVTENEALFNLENPDHDAAGVFDGADVEYRTCIAEHFVLSVQGATAGTFQVTDTNQTTNADSDTIAWNATASDVSSALNDIGNLAPYHVYGGPFPDNDIYVVIEEGDNNVIYSNKTGMQIKAGFSLDVTPTLTTIIDGNNGYSLPATGTVDAWFDLLDTTEGTMVAYNNAFDVQSIVQWGNAINEPSAGGDALWVDNAGNTATNVATGGLTEGYTLRYIYDPATTLSITPDSADDYWQHSKIHTPGYHSNGVEWLLVELPGMGLSLATGADAGAELLSIQDASGTPSTNGLPNTGPVQIGSEQIAYTTIDRSAGTISGFTTAQDHSEGDPVFFVSGGIATDALPVDSIKLKRLTGAPKLHVFTVRHSPYLLVRTPDDGTYTPDYPDSVTVTNEVGTGYTTATEGDMYVGTLDLSGSNPRIKWLLLEISIMNDGAGTQPQRAAVNEIEFVFDVDVFDSSSYLPDTTTIYGTMDQLLQNALIPSGAYADSTTATAVTGYTTERGLLWPILLDLCDFGNRRIVVERDSQFRVWDNTLWTPGSSDMDGELPAETLQLTRDNVKHHEFNWVNGRNVGQVELNWRTPDGATEDTATFPTVHYFGAAETIGPYIYADATAAANAAIRRFWMLRRPHNVIFEIAGDGNSFQPLQVHGGTWDFGTGYNTLDRTYMVEGVDHELEGNEWNAVVQAIQISREDER